MSRKPNPNDIIQILEPHKWNGALAYVDEVDEDGVLAAIFVPTSESFNLAWIKLGDCDYRVIGSQNLVDLNPPTENESSAA